MPFFAVGFLGIKEAQNICLRESENAWLVEDGVGTKSGIKFSRKIC